VIKLYPSARLAIGFSCFALLLALAACGSADKNANAPSGAPSVAPATTASGAPSESEAAGSFPVTIKHVKGEYTLNEKPKVIVVLDTKFIDQLLALDEQPAGSVKAAGSNADFPEYLSDRLGEVAVVGTRDEPNIEAVVALNPDLILMTDFQEKVYDSVSKIAPTLELEFDEDWRATLETMGKITGKQAEAKAIIQDYADKTARLKNQIAEKLGSETVALIRPRKEGIRVHTSGHRTGAILYTDLGLNVPASVAAVDDTAYEISPEVIGEVGADHYFLLSDALFAEAVQKLEDSKVWASLEAVKNKRVYHVDSTLWIAYYGPIANNLIIDQAAAALLGQP